nr:MAG TPA: Protein involved in formate dehydrogenase formation [Caudoviricetes sp.]
MADQGWCWCPHCGKWVPEKLMNYGRDEAGKLIRVCTPCLEGTSADNNYVLDEHHEQTACIYCGSYNTVEQVPRWLWFKCISCGKIFRRM